jgi:hypothetical protein
MRTTVARFFFFRYAVFKEQGTASGARLSQGCTDATLARERLSQASRKRTRATTGVV